MIPAYLMLVRILARQAVKDHLHGKPLVLQAVVPKRSNRPVQNQPLGR
jgi:hypothetical protein